MICIRGISKMLCKTLLGNKKIFLALAFLTLFLLNITSVFAVTYATTEDVFGILGDGTERTGAYNITFKVRSCDDSACSGESWSSLYTNATYNDISSLSNNRYFQYQSLFYTEDQNYTPMLFNVTFGDTREEVEVGYLTTYWVTPVTDTNVPQNEFFKVQIGVNCTGGVCGDVNVTLDPEEVKNAIAEYKAKQTLEEEKNFFERILIFIKEVFGR